MKRIKVTIEGIAPILFNRMTQEQQDKIITRQTGGVRTLSERQEEARQKVYRNADGLYLPSENLIKCLILGATKASLKYGRKSLAPFIEALVFTETTAIPFGISEPDFIDERPGRVPPRTGPRVIICRPGLSTGWRLTFHLIVVDDRLPIDNIKTALQEAGILIGLCDYRPRFGRFKVVEWQEIQ